MPEHVLHCTLPVHPRTGLTAVGIVNGKAVWPILGGAPDPDPAAPPAADPPKPADPPAADPPKPADPAKPAPPSAGEVKDLPDWAQKIIADARKDAGDSRTAAKTAADQAQRELVDKLQVALGTKPDPKLDPTALAEQLTASNETARAAAVELAVYKASAAQSANPVALLDRNSFTSKLKGLDPKASDFDTKVEAVIKDAIASDPTLKAGLAPAASSIPAPGGTGENGTKRPTSLGQAVAAAYKH